MKDELDKSRQPCPRLRDFSRSWSSSLLTICPGLNLSDSTLFMKGLLVATESYVASCLCGKASRNTTTRSWMKQQWRPNTALTANCISQTLDTSPRSMPISHSSSGPPSWWGSPCWRSSASLWASLETASIAKSWAESEPSKSNSSACCRANCRKKYSTTSSRPKSGSTWPKSYRSCPSSIRSFSSL